MLSRMCGTSLVADWVHPFRCWSSESGSREAIHRHNLFGTAQPPEQEPQSISFWYFEYFVLQSCPAARGITRRGRGYPMGNVCQTFFSMSPRKGCRGVSSWLGVRRFAANWEACDEGPKLMALTEAVWWRLVVDPRCGQDLACCHKTRRHGVRPTLSPLSLSGWSTRVA